MLTIEEINEVRNKLYIEEDTKYKEACRSGSRTGQAAYASTCAMLNVLYAELLLKESDKK